LPGIWAMGCDMAKPLKELLDKVSSDVKAKAELKALAIIDEMGLAELRKALGVTQVTLADEMGVQQPTIARIEKQQDIYVSTVRNYIESLGGHMELYASFPDGTRIRIDQFQSV
jgi:DNA-binding XRE family transcriptional regulator